MQRIKIVMLLLYIGLIVVNLPRAHCQLSPAYSWELESELRNALFSGYHPMQRPRQLIGVTTSLNMLSLNYLDIKEQKLSVTAYFYFDWLDERLSWVGNSTYDNILFMFSDEKSIWSPALIVENSVDDIDVISKPNIPMRINRGGRVAWMPAGIFATHCESTITYWPLDTQTCHITLSSWAYTANEVFLLFDDPAVVMTFFQENGEWELVDKSSSSSEITREFERFSRLTFTLKFRRRPLFHTLNTLFPVVLMGFLTVAIFKLSPESGERVGLALTILLAYAVYLGLISESIPQTSISTSLLATYLASILFLQTLSVLLTVIYIDVYITPPETTIPSWMQSMASFLSQLTSPGCCRKSSRTSVANAENETEMDAQNNKTTIEGFPVGKPDAWDDDNAKGDNDDKQYTWKEIALLLDKITMYIYLFFVTAFTLALTCIMIIQYNI